MDDVELDLEMDSSPESDLMQPVVRSPATPKRAHLGGKPTSMAQLSAAMSRRSKSPASSAGSKSSSRGRPKRKATSVATPKYAQSPTSSPQSSGSNKRSYADMSKDEVAGTSAQGKEKRKPKTKTKKIKVSNSDPSSDLVGKVNEGEYIVEKIVGKKQITTEDGRLFHYFIKWKGWASSHNTWEPVENLDGCQELLDEYEKGVKQKRGKSGKKHNAEESEGELRNDNKENEDEMTKTQKELVEYGIITTKWPADLIPLELSGAVLVDGHLCYVVKTKTEEPMNYMSPENCSVVRCKVFCHDFPHIVIEYYEKILIFANRTEDNDLGNKAAKAIHAHRQGPKPKSKKKNVAAATAAGGKENANNAEVVEEDNDSDDDGIENIKTEVDEKQTTITKPDVDLFGLPDNLEDSDSSSDSDIFVQITSKDKNKNKRK